MPGPAIALAGASLASGVMGANAAKKGAAAQSKAAKDATALQSKIYEETKQNYSPYLTAGNDAMAAYLYEIGLGPRPMMGAVAPAIETFIEPGKSGTALNLPGGIGNPISIGGGKDVTKYRVNGQVFGTLEEAQKYANANRTGGTEYQGYSVSPMAKYLMEQGVDSIQGSAAAGGGLFSGATLKALEDNRRTVIGADTADYFAKLFGLTNMGMAAAGNQAGAGSSYANNVGNLQMQAGAAKAAGYAGQAQAIGNTIGDMAGIYGYFNSPTAAYSAPTMSGYGGGR